MDTSNHSNVFYIYLCLLFVIKSVYMDKTETHHTYVNSDALFFIVHSFWPVILNQCSQHFVYDWLLFGWILNTL